MNRKKIKGNQIILDKSDWIWKIWINWIISKKKKKSRCGVNEDTPFLHRVTELHSPPP